MKQMIGIVLGVIALFFAGCGGGAPSVGFTPPPPGTVVVAPPPSGPDTTTSSDSEKVSYLSSYWYGNGSGMYGDQYDYGFQQVKVGDTVVVGVIVYGHCQNYSGSCFEPNVPVIFRMTDDNGPIGPEITVVSNSSSVATTTVPINLITVPNGGSHNLTVTATVEDKSLIDATYPIPKTTMTVNVIAADLVPVYSASTDQNVSINIIAGTADSNDIIGVARTAAGGMGYSGGTSASVRVKNTGNTAWWGYGDSLKRVYMVLDNAPATSSLFFSSSWYSTQVVSSLGYSGSYTLPGETSYLDFYLEANGVAPGKYQECFKLQTNPTEIDQTYFKFALVDPLDIAGSHFCVDITVLPESLPREPGVEVANKLVGKLYWKSIGK